MPHGPKRLATLAQRQGRSVQAVKAALDRQGRRHAREAIPRAVRRAGCATVPAIAVSTAASANSPRPLWSAKTSCREFCAAVPPPNWPGRARACNGHKYAKTHSSDPQAGRSVPLFSLAASAPGARFCLEDGLPAHRGRTTTGRGHRRGTALELPRPRQLCCALRACRGTYPAWDLMEAASDSTASITSPTTAESRQGSSSPTGIKCPMEPARAACCCSVPSQCVIVAAAKRRCLCNNCDLMRTASYSVHRAGNTFPFN